MAYRRTPSGGSGAGAVSSVASRTGDVVLTKTDVGLANVDNTADTAKPVSTAQATADALAIAKATLDANSVLYAVTDDTPAALAMGASTILARLAAGNIVAATPAQLRTLLALVIGTDVQAFDAELAAIAGLTSAADRLPYFTGSGAAALATFTAAGRALVDDADAAAQRVTLGAYGIIAKTTYNPATDVLYNVTTSFADVDATNLAVTFTAPSGGKVLVGVQFFAVDGGNWLIANLREGGSDVANTVFTASYLQGSKITPVHVQIPVTGLTPGSSHTYVLGAKGNIAFNNAIRVGQSTPHGPGLLTVTDAGP